MPDLQTPTAGPGTNQTWLSPECEAGLVSVIIPTYNRADMVGDAIDSVLAQTYRPIECIVVDDGSTDYTRDVVRAREEAVHPGLQVRYLRQDNSGAQSARNRGLSVCRGQYISLLDSDDLYLENKLESQVSLLRDTDCDFCYGVSVGVDERGKALYAYGSPWPTQGEAVITRYLFDNNAPLFRRHVVVTCGPWDVSLLCEQEVEYSARVKKAGYTGAFLPRVLSITRNHTRPSIGKSRTTGPRSLHYLASVERMVQRLDGWVRGTPAEQQELNALARVLLRTAHGYVARDPNAAYRCLRSAVAMTTGFDGYVSRVLTYAASVIGLRLTLSSYMTVLWVREAMLRPFQSVPAAVGAEALAGFRRHQERARGLK